MLIKIGMTNAIRKATMTKKKILATMKVQKIKKKRSNLIQITMMKK
jgi:hypothetical protein